MSRFKEWYRQKVKRPHDTTPQAHHTYDCADHSSVPKLALASRTSDGQSQLQEPSPPQDLWKSAFDQLGQEEQHALRTSLVPSSTTDVLNNVIETTKEKYEEFQEKGGIRIRKSTGEEVNIRKVSQKIINATLSFKEFISAGVACDPTGHAASAWAVVSLGLTMTKNHYDRRDALLESSQYLAETLARCGYIEKKICHDRPDEEGVVTQAIITLYRAILQYAARVMASHKMSTGDKLLDSVTATTTQYIAELQCSIEKEQQKLSQLAQLQKIEQVEKITETIQKQNKKAAEDILAVIDGKLSKSLNALILRFGLPIAEKAFWNSYNHEDLCLENTRVQTRSQITHWADSSESECIFWLNGGAGTGKSTIARTVAQSFEAKGQLGASFFFKRGEPDRGNARRLIPTITNELIKQNKNFASDVLGQIEEDPQIAAKDLREQFSRLLLQPLKRTTLYESKTLVIVIDALDECEDEREIEQILQFLPQFRESESMRLKIFLTSRPELPLRRFFAKVDSHQSLVLERVAEEAIKEDIMQFLEYRFTKIGGEANAGKDWPGDEVIETLTTMCIPLFISAATICLFVEQPGEDPVERLAEIQEGQRKYLTKMEKTYMPILDRTLHERDEDDQEQLLTRLKRTIGVIILLSVPLSVNALSEFVGIRSRIVKFYLDSFHSVLRIPDDQDLPVRILHLSFREFLLTTKSHFRVNEKKTHDEIVLRCFSVMKQYLKRNICELQSFGMERKDIDDRTIRQCVPPHLQYSCQYWVLHLKGSSHSISDMEIMSFLEEHFLHWLEAMSLMGVMSETVDMVNTLYSRTHNGSSSEYSKFLIDANRFILQNIQIANAVPLQLYASGLVFTPTSSLVRKTFKWNRLPRIRSLPRMEESWGANRQTLEGHSGLVQAVAFSPDGQTIASGSNDNTIKLWNAKTGEQRHTLEGHLDWVRAVAFSPDGQTIASGSNDNTIKLWNTETGKQRHTLEGHSGLVRAVAFSSDGQTIASASDDNTIKLWNAETGEQRHTLEGHLDWVRAMAFSPDGQTIASASNDNTIKLWNVEIGEQRHTLEGHSGLVQAVAFSPDGQTIASGSNDNTIKLWNVETGKQYHTLEGHLDWVRAMAFSPDGQTIASASDDNTIKLWNIETGKQRHTLEGHLDWVRAVAFSPDGQTIASASDDNTIKVWNAETGEQRHTLEGHSGLVQAVAFSPDGQTIASASDDNSIKLWNVETGEQCHALEGHSDLAQAVAFHSRDGIHVSPTPYSQDMPQVWLANHWVRFGGEDVLWLPSEYRQFSCSATKEGTLALGYPNGRVFIIRLLCT
ncbi:NACHT and WD40 domain protein [Penicillium herquei]|nr:NACHT and WD40 domain protein [Penicillium herquei]